MDSRIYNQYNIQLPDREEAQTLRSIGKSIGPFTWGIIITSALVYLLSYYYTNEVYFLSDIPVNSIQEGRVYALASCVFVYDHWFHMIVGLYVWIALYAISIEYTIGSITYAVVFFSNVLIVQLIWVFLSYCLYTALKEPFFVMESSNGIWFIINLEIVVWTQESPEAIERLLGHIQIRRKFLPFLLFVFICLIHIAIRIDCLVSWLYGYLFSFLYYKHLDQGYENQAQGYTSNEDTEEIKHSRNNKVHSLSSTEAYQQSQNRDFSNRNDKTSREAKEPSHAYSDLNLEI